MSGHPVADLMTMPPHRLEAGMRIGTRACFACRTMCEWSTALRKHDDRDRNHEKPDRHCSEAVPAFCASLGTGFVIPVRAIRHANPRPCGGGESIALWGAAHVPGQAPGVAMFGWS